MSGDTTTEGDTPEEVVVRRSDAGWQVAGEETADLTSAMVLADLLAVDVGAPTQPPKQVSEEDEAARLAVTVAQLEHALTARVRVEQAIGVLAERHRLRPRQAFDLLRNVARSAGRRVIEVSEVVVDSATNPLLPLPQELARAQQPVKTRGRSPRHARTVLPGDAPAPALRPPAILGLLVRHEPPRTHASGARPRRLVRHEPPRVGVCGPQVALAVPRWGPKMSVAGATVPTRAFRSARMRPGCERMGEAAGG